MSGFAPDSPIVTSVERSPNHGERRGHRRPDMIVLHYTGMESAKAALERLCGIGSDPDPSVSAHYFVYEDGRIVQCVAEARRAWHAGISCWEGKEDINSRSIGIEIANPGHDFGYPDFPEPQIRQVIALCRDIAGRHFVRNAGVSQLQGLLAEYGYGLNPTGFYGDSTRDVVAAFQRHFRPARVDGIADGSTLDTLERLVIARRFLLAAAGGVDARAP